MTASTQAVNPRFRVTDLATLGFSGTDIDKYGTMGINNDCQVCYGRVVSGNIRAWVWLPSADYGLSAGLHDLNTISTGTENLPNIARDMNTDGRVVGVTGGDEPKEGLATEWNLAVSGVPFSTLGTLGGSSPWSGAHAVSDSNPAIVVGDSSRMYDCICPPNDPPSNLYQVRWGFKRTLGSPIAGLNPRNEDTQSFARDINPSGRVAGFSDCRTSDAGGPIACNQVFDCQSAGDSVYWSTATPTLLTDLGSNGSETRGINSAGEMVGWGFNNDFVCLQRALFWTSGGTLTELGNYMPTGDSADGSRAEAINNASQPKVVGWNTTDGEAVLWEKQGGTPPWTAIDLNSSATNVISSCADTKWDLRQAHDVNNVPWIVVVAYESAVNEFKALLLTPVQCCPYDTDNDGDVDNADIDAVRNQWGDCAQGSICTADVDFNCTVNIDDLFLVNRYFGTNCEGCFGGAGAIGGGPMTCEELLIYFADGGNADLLAGIAQEMQAGGDCSN